MSGQAALIGQRPPRSMPVSGQAALIGRRPPRSMPVSRQAALIGRRPLSSCSWIVVGCIQPPDLRHLQCPALQPVSRPSAGSHFELIPFDPELAFC